MDQRDGFERRLAAARGKAGLSAPGGRGGLPVGSWGIGFRAGIEFVSALLVGIALGLLLDRWLGTWPWLFLVMFVVGAVAGVLNLMRLFRAPPASGDGTG